MGFNRQGTYLTDLIEPRKRELCRERLLNALSYDACATFCFDEWGISTNKQTISNFFRSDEGERLQREEHDEIKRTFLEVPMVEKGTRVLALQKRAAQLSHTLDFLPMGTEEWFQASAEYRQYLKLIKDEIEGSRITLDKQADSPAEWWEQAKLLSGKQA